MTLPEIEVLGAGTEARVADFTAFFRSEYPGLVALATAVSGDRQTGEDIAAETMSRAYRRWHRIGAYDRPGAWTRRVAVNLLHSRRRRLASEVRALLRLRGEVDSADRAGRLDGQVVGADNFQRLIEPLAPRQRTAAALHYLHDLSVADIAAAMDCAEGTVKSHLHAARGTIAHAIEESPEP